MSNSESHGVLLVAHGTISQLSEIPDFLRAIRRGRPASDALIEEITRRYQAIGGSPLLTITEAQRQGLEALLGRPVYVGMRFCQPSLETAFAQAQQDGRTHLVLVPLAPYSVELYGAEARKRFGEFAPTSALELTTCEAWGEHPSLIAAHCANILANAETQLRAGCPLLLTAHSLPLRVIQMGDKYADEVRASASAIGRTLGVPFELAFQSEGADGGDWLGPSLSEALERVVASGHREVVVAPIGFLCEHVETLYDLDLEFAEQARARGVTVHRVPTLNTHPKLLEALADLATKALTYSTGRTGSPT